MSQVDFAEALDPAILLCQVVAVEHFERHESLNGGRAK
jgi:hypothetical protein